MKKEYSGPKYTAYALNELSGAERIDVEREVQADPELQKHIAEIQAFGDTLKTALAEEPVVELSREKRQTVLDASRARPSGKLVPFRYRHMTSLATAAAAVILVAVGLLFYGPTESEEFEVAYLEVDRLEYIEDPELVRAPALRDETVRHKLGVEDNHLHLADVEVSLMEFSEATRPMAASRPMSPLPPARVPSLGVGRRMQTVAGFAAEDYYTDGGMLSPSIDDFPERHDSAFRRVADHPLSTFSIDVDTASYSVMRRFLSEGRLPPKDALRVEELVNYFPYDYAQPESDVPFAAHMEAAPAPWNPNHQLVRIALKGRELADEDRPPLNLVFLIDVSGSMYPANRLPLVKRSMQTLVRQLDGRDRVAIVVYAGAAGMVLPPTPGDDTQTLLDALERLKAGGSTAGGQGIQLAYETAREMYEPGAMNRVILCTDGDFNVGIRQRGDLERLIEEKAKSGVFLTVLGFGMGNYKDSTLEVLSNKGNGNYAYIDDFSEARKVLVDEMLGTLVTIAKDVKIQVEFNPAHVAGYRLIGYENRMLRKEDFNNDQVDAGDIGAGHTVTAFYEIIPVGQPVTPAPEVDPLRYQPERAPEAVRENEVLTLKLRYKEPDGDRSALLTYTLDADVLRTEEMTRDFRFAVAVAAFGQRLRGNEHVQDYAWDDILSLAESALDDDPYGHRAEFIRLLRNAMAITKSQ